MVVCTTALWYAMLADICWMLRIRSACRRRYCISAAVVRQGLWMTRFICGEWRQITLQLYQSLQSEMTAWIHFASIFRDCIYKVLFVNGIWVFLLDLIIFLIDNLTLTRGCTHYYSLLSHKFTPFFTQASRVAKYK